MKKQMKRVLTVLTLGCFMITGCTATGSGEQTGNQPDETAVDRVYRVMPSGRTITQWDNSYGVVTHDGDFILPFDNHEVYLIYDKAADEQLWIQTSKRIVEDPTLSAEDLWKEENFDKVHTEYMLYDLQGNLLKSLGDNGIMTVYDNLVLHYNGQLVDKNTGALYYDDVNTLHVSGEYYVMNTKDYTQVRIMDKDLNVVYETAGGFVGMNDQYYISAEIRQEDGTRLRGLQHLDGTEIIPYGYDYFTMAVVNDAPYIVAQRNNFETVHALEDGSIVYQESGEYPDYDYIQYLLKDCMIIQRREVVATAENGGWPIYGYFSQLYGYDGAPIGEKYRSLYPCTEANKATLAHDGQNEMLFNATKMNGEELIINQSGEVIYQIPENGWINVIRSDRVILNSYDDDTAILCDRDGNQLTEKVYQYMYTTHFEDVSGEYISANLIDASYNIAGKTMYDLLDMDGNIIIERAKNIQVLSQDRFWVEKGFSQGLMDNEGNWIYEQSVFATATDE